MDSSNLILQIKKELINLPGEAAHIDMSPMGREKSSQAIKQAKNVRQSAVSLVLFEKNTDLHFVLIQRSEYKGTHSKQISFPGGKSEPEDSNSVATAIRETKEEIGIDEDALTHLGKLTKVYIPVSNFEVHPHVFYMQQKQKFQKQIREVQEIIPVPLRNLINEENLHKKDIELTNGLILKNVPCFLLNGKVVWGATAIILNEFKTILKRKENTSLH